MVPRRWPVLVAAAVVASALAAAHGCQLVGSLNEPRAAHCADGIKDDGEDGVDCNTDGVTCPKCDGASCSKDEECLSLLCDGHCVEPNCNDGTLDCWLCHRCSAKADCASNADCAVGRCVAGTCQPCTDPSECPGMTECTPGGSCLEVTCHNHVRDTAMDTSEEGVDCGGHCPNPCDAGTGGAGGGTSSSSSSGTGGSSSSSTSSSSSSGTGGSGGATCGNNKTDGSETDIDCGGGACPPCAPTQGCQGAGDCKSHVCTVSVCHAPTCADGEQNGTETDVDCGGPCKRCSDGQSCQLDDECKSHRCDPSSHKCAVASCGNTIKDGDETDVNCGAACIGKPCKAGQACASILDCEGGTDCVHGFCRNTTCTGCSPGGGVCGACEHDGCAVDGECRGGACHVGQCTADTCSNGVQDSGESGTDCGGGCQGCPIQRACGSAADCQPGLLCMNSVCRAAHCNDGIFNGAETDTDCGANCPPCADGQTCLSDNDCPFLHHCNIFGVCEQ
jgi:hypothetical protein